MKRIKKKHIPPAVFLLLFVSIGFKILIISQDINEILKYQEDDAFFYYTITRNIIEIGEPVANKGIYTNGFHPLYLVILTPVFFLTYSVGINAPIYVTLLVFSVINIATGYFVYISCKSLINRTTGLIAASIWVTNPYVHHLHYTGMEIPLLIFFVSLLTSYLLTMDDRSKLDIRQAVAIGLLLGFIFLSRMDGALIAVSVAITLFIRSLVNYSSTRETDNLLLSIKSIIVMTFSALTIASPWFIYQISTVETIFPVSAEGSRYELLSGSQSTYFELALRSSKTFLGGAVNVLIDLNHTVVSGTIFLIILFILPLGFVVIRYPSFTKRTLFRLDFFIISAILYHIFYIFYQLRSRWYYALFSAFITSIIFSVIVGKLIKSTNNDYISHIIKISVVLIILSSLVIGGFDLYTGPDTPRPERKIVADEVENTIPSDKRIASNGGGIYQYYNENHDILLIAPVLNPEANDAWRRGDIGRYLVQNNIDYFLNQKPSVDAVNRQMRQNNRGRLTTTQTWDSPGHKIVLAEVEINNTTIESHNSSNID